MINADNSKQLVKVDGKMFDIILELNGILDNFIQGHPDVLLGVLAAWSDKLSNTAPKDKHLFDLVFMISTKYLTCYRSEDITPDE